MNNKMTYDEKRGYSGSGPGVLRHAKNESGEPMVRAVK